MYGLAEIIAMNNQVAVKAEDNHDRHCSYSGDTQTGVVLHSAKLRSTVFLFPRQAKRFLAKWLATNSADRRDHIVEAYF